MENTSNSEFEDYQSSTLLAKLKDFNLNGIERTNQIIDELRKRGYTEQVEVIEQNLIKEYPIYGRFWRRLLATVIDWMIIGLVGIIIGFVFHSLLAQLGSYGFLVGILISSLYFGMMNNKKYGGQTFGKKICKLKVVDSNQELLTFKQSISRFLILIAPLILYWVGKFDLSLPYEIIVVLYIMMIILCIMTPLLIIANRPSRQGLHDLCIRTFVMNTDAYPKQNLSKLRNYSLINFYITTIALAIVLTLIKLQFTPSEELISDLRPLKSKIDNLPLVVESGIARSTTTTYVDNQADKTIEFIRLSIILDKNILIDNNIQDFSKIKLVKDAVRIVLNNYQDFYKLDYIQVNLIYGFDIGIASSHINRHYANSIDEWREIVNEPK